MGLISRSVVALAAVLGAVGGVTAWGAAEPILARLGLLPAAPLWLKAGLAGVLGVLLGGLGAAVRLQSIRHEENEARRCRAMGLSMTERPGNRDRLIP